MFILVAFAGLAFASCNKDEDLVVSSKENNPAKTDKGTWVNTSKDVIIEDGEKFSEYTNSISKQKVYLSLGETTKAASKYNKAKGEEWVIDGSPEGGFWRTICNSPGNNCYNTVEVGPSGEIYVLPHVKDL